jgi:hypothetical protein
MINLDYLHYSNLFLITLLSNKCDYFKIIFDNYNCDIPELLNNFNSIATNLDDYNQILEYIKSITK